MVTIPISVSRWRVSTAILLESEAKMAPSSAATPISTAMPVTPLSKRAPIASRGDYEGGRFAMRGIDAESDYTAGEATACLDRQVRCG
jgi:hypothetical protein